MMIGIRVGIVRCLVIVLIAALGRSSLVDWLFTTSSGVRTVWQAASELWLLLMVLPRLLLLLSRSIRRSMRLFALHLRPSGEII